jgi:hypothetical protein
MVDLGHEMLGHDNPGPDPSRPDRLRPDRSSPDRSSPDRLPPQAPLGISVGIGAAAVVAAAFADAVVPHRLVSLRWLLLTLVVAGFALWAADTVATVIIAGLAFVLANGFLVNHQGELSWHGQADLWRLAVLVVAAGLGLALGYARSRRAARRRFVDLEAWANGTVPSRYVGSDEVAS